MSTNTSTRVPGKKFEDEYKKRCDDTREKQRVNTHIYLPPHWKNSFHLNPPYSIIACAILIAFQLIIHFFVSLENVSETFRITLLCTICVIYILDFFNNGVWDQLNNVLSEREFNEKISQLRRSNPTITFKVSASHQDNNSQTGSSSSKKSGTNEVTTYTEDFILPVKKAIDATADALVYFEKAKSFRVSCFITYSYASQEDQTKFERIKRLAEVKASLKDDHSSSKEDVSIPALPKSFVVFAEGNKIDPILSKFVYIVYSMVGLSFLYRVFLNRRVSYLELCVHKKLVYDSSQKFPQLDEAVIQEKLLQEAIQENEKKRQALTATLFQPSSEQLTQNQQDVLMDKKKE